MLGSQCSEHDREEDDCPLSFDTPGADVTLLRLLPAGVVQLLEEMHRHSEPVKTRVCHAGYSAS